MGLFEGCFAFQIEGNSVDHPQKQAFLPGFLVTDGEYLVNVNHTSECRTRGHPGLGTPISHLPPKLIP